MSKTIIKLATAVDADFISKVCVAIRNVTGMSLTDARHSIVESLVVDVTGILAEEVNHLVGVLNRVRVDTQVVLKDLNDDDAMVYDNTQDFVEFGDVCRDRCGQQAQYGSGYLKASKTRPNLGAGLRFRGSHGHDLDIANYHDIEIHKDDVDTFVERVLTYRTAIGNMELAAADEYRSRAMQGKRFLTNIGVVGGAKAYDAVEALLSDRERADSKEDGKDLLRKLCQLRPGEQMSFINSGTCTRLTNT